jgi:catalase
VWALKFYTAEGNYDTVGNNTLVFFIRDPLKFAGVRTPGHVPDGDRDIPTSWRHMNLYGSHTHMWINAHGEKFSVKHHFITDQGVENLTQVQADELVKLDTDHHSQTEQGAWEPSNMVPGIGASSDNWMTPNRLVTLIELSVPGSGARHG